MKILNTTNYSEFAILTGNRPVKKQKVASLIDEATNGLNLFPYCPIIVYKENDKLMIIDGQHRFQASQKMKQPIYYVVCDKLTLPQIAKLNSNSSNWKSKDFLDCYIKTGIKDYEDINYLIETHKVAYATAVDLLMKGDCKSKGNMLKHFKEGTFKSNYFQETCVLIESVKDVFGQYEFWNHGYLIEAYRQLLEKNKFEVEHLKAKIKSAPHILEKRLSVKEYLFTIERVYNDRLQTRISIF